ncbi:3-oxoacyl-[acyl-carrier-protein] reductase FabG [Pontiella desulfatans]|uniref:3-oxoacyl-[acyl-carrier-protein] reductase FabG n=1 Tax=Pontiella desulfatans TaxID=2750659 RepID=A0A6C2UA82_PONDE|nr:SDR family oxidoreductase [Pontiella desulfatans]VGO16763.1 3-oxoacyl-[acyl-carrier-protein] reductase FabG [Pontiella desulfatans]
MELGLHGKVAMVAGASRGLGYGIARELAREGALVSIGSRTEADVFDAAEVLTEETGSEVLPNILDVSNPESIAEWLESTTEAFGGVDCLVVNAGGPPAGTFDDFADSDWQSAFELTLMSSVRMIRAVLPAMREVGGGAILTVTSVSVKEPIDFLLLSNVMRSGVTSLAKSLSQQLAPENIRINNLMPGRIDTDRVQALDALKAEARELPVEEVRAANELGIPLGRYGTIEEFGRLGAFLLSDAASYITGQTIAVDGGSMKTVW